MTAGTNIEGRPRDGIEPAIVVRVPIDGPPVGRLPVLEHECTIAGLRVVAQPPGRMELACEAECLALNFVPGAMYGEVVRVGGTDYAASPMPEDSLAWYPLGADLRLVCENPDWELLVEIDPARLDRLAGEALETRPPTAEFVPWTHDPLAGAPAKLLIEHLRRPAIDPLYAEGLALAVVGRGLWLAGGGLREPAPSRRVDRRLARAIEYAEAHLAERLSVAELAAVATMSASHFARSFRAATGEPVWGYVQRRRAERAHELLTRTRCPLSRVAEACGYADAGHLARAFRTRYGRSPGEVRAG